MTGRESSMRVTVTRVMKRRAESVSTPDQPGRTRVVLGEISTNIPGNPNLNPCSQSQVKRLSRVRSHKRTPRPHLGKTPIGDVVGLPNKVVDDDVDGNWDDSQSQSCYAASIHDYLLNLEKEEKRRPLSDYMQRIQNDVTASMRWILVDWLIELAEDFNLVPDTLHLTISYIDRYLSCKPIIRQKLQLLGATAMLIASKYEEINPKAVQKFCEMTADTYTKEEVVEMEVDVLNTLKHEMGSPTIMTFLGGFNKVAQGVSKNPNSQLEFLGCYLAELSLLDYGCVEFLPSMMAAAVVFLANFTAHPKAHP